MRKRLICPMCKEVPLEPNKQSYCRDCMNIYRRSRGRRPGESTWYGMRNRCTKSWYREYPYYGGRGIAYDPKWETYDGFWEDMGPTYKAGLTLDRIDNDGNYCKENCRWATMKEQMSNTRKTVRLTIGTETKSLMEWCRLYKRPYGTMHKRIRMLNLDPETALKTPAYKVR